MDTSVSQFLKSSYPTTHYKSLEATNKVDELLRNLQSVSKSPEKAFTRDNLAVEGISSKLEAANSLMNMFSASMDSVSRSSGSSVKPAVNMRTFGFPPSEFVQPVISFVEPQGNSLVAPMCSYDFTNLASSVDYINVSEHCASMSEMYYNYVYAQYPEAAPYHLPSQLNPEAEEYIPKYMRTENAESALQKVMSSTKTLPEKFVKTKNSNSQTLKGRKLEESSPVDSVNTKIKSLSMDAVNKSLIGPGDQNIESSWESFPVTSSSSETLSSCEDSKSKLTGILVSLSSNFEDSLEKSANKQEEMEGGGCGNCLDGFENPGGSDSNMSRGDANGRNRRELDTILADEDSDSDSCSTYSDSSSSDEEENQSESEESESVEFESECEEEEDDDDDDDGGSSICFSEEVEGAVKGSDKDDSTVEEDLVEFVTVTEDSVVEGCGSSNFSTCSKNTNGESKSKNRHNSDEGSENSILAFILMQDHDSTDEEEVDDDDRSEVGVDEEDYSCDLFDVELDPNDDDDDWGISSSCMGLMISNIISPARCDDDDTKRPPHDDELDGMSEMTNKLLKANQRWNDEIDRNLSDRKNSPLKIRFSDEVKIFPVENWCRRGPWEESARDRMRFNNRIQEMEPVLKPILTKEHRSKVFNKMS